jgi:hypothetical protein
MKVGLGQMCLSPSAFYSMELSDFLIAAQGFHDLEQHRQRAEWERTRWLASVVLQPHAKKGTRIKPEDIAKFPWEKKEKKTANKMLAHTLKEWSKNA